MALQNAVTGYFRVGQDAKGDYGVALSASKGGPIEWRYMITIGDGPGLTLSLVKFLDETLIRNVEPVFATSVLEASDRLELDYSVQSAILEAVAKANAPEITWQEVVNRIDRMQAQLDYLRHIAETGQLQAMGTLEPPELLEG